MTANFAITGAAGYIAPRHLRAIRDTNNKLVAAVDPKDSVGILDQFSFEVPFFTEIERFDRHLEKLRRGPEAHRVNYLSVCSPNYLHDAHCRLGLRVGADVICEKPLVINPWNIDRLAELENETGHRIYSVLQLRVHPKLVALREKIQAQAIHGQHNVELTYITARGPWYSTSWKGNPEKSGGVLVDIGIHFFDLLVWLFGPSFGHKIHVQEPRRASGFLDLEKAKVRWFLSVNPQDLPFPLEVGKRTTYRSITVDDHEIEFSDGFTDLHTRIYENVLEGKGFGLTEARKSIEYVFHLRNAALSPIDELSHPFVQHPPSLR